MTEVTSADIKKSILKVLKNETRPILLQILLHKTCQDIRANKYSEFFISRKEFCSELEELIRDASVGKNKFEKYFIDYLDYPETNVTGEGYLEIDPVTGNGYITIKKHEKEYKKSSHFVHRKNLNGAKNGDYVRFVELDIKDKKRFTKFSRADSKIEAILPKNDKD